MDLGNMGLFKLLSRRMDWLTQRQETLSQNIANADTPEYKPSDLKPFNFRDALSDARRLKPATTSTTHLTGTLGPGGMDKAQRQRDPYETAPDGNAVILEEQMLKQTQNMSDYQTMVSLYRKQVGMIKMAIRGNSGAM